jgi:hypothetical protein
LYYFLCRKNAVKKLGFVVTREETGKLARVEIEAGNQVFNLLELSRSPLKFDEREDEGEDVSEVTDLNEIANAKTIWIVKEKITHKKAMEDKNTRRGMKGSESGQLTNQEKLLKKLQAMSNDTEQGEGKLNF